MVVDGWLFTKLVGRAAMGGFLFGSWSLGPLIRREDGGWAAVVRQWVEGQQTGLDCTGSTARWAWLLGLCFDFMTSCFVVIYLSYLILFSFWICFQISNRSVMVVAVDSGERLELSSWFVAKSTQFLLGLKPGLSFLLACLTLPGNPGVIDTIAFYCGLILSQMLLISLVNLAQSITLCGPCRTIDWRVCLSSVEREVVVSVPCCNPSWVL